jgi:hypothetical protein
MPTTFVKDPSAVLDYAFDWSSWLADDTISSYTITPESGLTVDSHSESAGKITFVLSGGIAATRRRVLCNIVTATGLTDERSMFINLYDR